MVARLVFTGYLKAFFERSDRPGSRTHAGQSFATDGLGTAVKVSTVDVYDSMESRTSSQACYLVRRSIQGTLSRTRVRTFHYQMTTRPRQPQTRHNGVLIIWGIFVFLGDLFFVLFVFLCFSAFLCCCASLLFCFSAAAASLVVCFAFLFF